MSGLSSLALLGARILLALIFVISGWGKISGYAGTQSYMESMGVPGALLPLVILLEFGGGLALMLGLGTRTLAVIFALFSVATGLIFHAAAAQQVMLLKNIAMAGGFLALAAAGPGRFSLDHRMGRNW